ncbi:MAG: hypothetical protein IPO21_07535 [Bacteroidales bacterium]|nr:hypothetical protein [Bacteroidales bacterium]
MSSCSEGRVNKTNPELLEINQQDSSVVESQEAIQTLSDTLIIPIGSGKVIFYRIQQAPIISKEFADSKDTLYFELHDFIGTWGELFNTSFCVHSVNLESVAIYQYYCTQALFNNDGSGGVYEIEGVEEHCNEKVQLNYADDNTFLTMFDRENFPHPNGQDSINIEKYLEASNAEYRKEHGSDIVLPPTEYITKTIFDIYIEDTHKVWCFNFIYGD